MKKRMMLKEHNTDEQRTYLHSYDDTREYLSVGVVYDAEVTVHDWHTHIEIGKQTFNSVCFEEIGVEIYMCPQCMKEISIKRSQTPFPPWKINCPCGHNWDPCDFSMSNLHTT